MLKYDGWFLLCDPLTWIWMGLGLGLSISHVYLLYLFRLAWLCFDSPFCLSIYLSDCLLVYLFCSISYCMNRFLRVYIYIYTNNKHINPLCDFCSFGCLGLFHSVYFCKGKLASSILAPGFFAALSSVSGLGFWMAGLSGVVVVWGFGRGG